MAFKLPDYEYFLLKTFNDQRLQNVNCDVSLVSQLGKVFPAHRFMLTATSSCMSELLTDGVTQLHLDNDDDTIQILLDVIYTGSLNLPEKFKNLDDVERIKGLGDLLKVKPLITLCENYLNDNNTDIMAGGDNAITNSIAHVRQRRKMTKSKRIKVEDKLSQEENDFRPFRKRKIPKLERDADGKFVRPSHESATKSLGEDLDSSEDDGSDDDFVVPLRTSNKRPYTPRNQSKKSLNDTFEEIVKKIDDLRKSGVEIDDNDDDNLSDISIDVEESPPAGDVQETLSQILEKIKRMKNSVDTTSVASGNAADTEEWKKCEYCTKFKGKKKGRLDFHVQFCKFAKFKCDLCFKPFLRNKDKVAHKCKKLTEQVICDLCGKILRDIQSMKLHMDVHNNIKKYPCPHCGKMFRRTTQRQAHVVHVHSKDRPHVCETCGSRFALKYELNRHAQKHSSYPTYGCIECGKFFYEKAKLTAHTKQHGKSNISIADNQQQTIITLSTTPTLAPSEMEVEVSTTPQVADPNEKLNKSVDVLGYIPVAVSSQTDRQNVETVTAVDQLTQAASQLQQQEFVHLTPVTYEGQSYYVTYQQQ